MKTSRDLGHRLYCQRCVWETHPHMLTTYCVLAHCDRCSYYGMMAMVLIGREPRHSIGGISRERKEQCITPRTPPTR